MMNLKTPLLKHQEAATKKMIATRIGALFMEMGTGKSRTAIELVYQRLDRIKNVVWFCPVSLKETVRYEIEKHTDCPPSDIYVFDHKTTERSLPHVFWYVVGIESMSSSSRIICTANMLIESNSFVIVDESGYIKGHRSRRTQWITDISQRARYRLILNGTPISQGVVDLFAQMRFLSPKILGYHSFYSFARNHLEYSEKYPGMIVRSHNTEYLAAKIKPYAYQVTKEECLDLPSKVYDYRAVSMTWDQRQYYEMAKDEILMEAAEDDFDSYTIFRLFNALQQIVSGFWNRKTEKGFELLAFSHNRLSALDDCIEKISETEKIIIWAKFTRDIESIAAMLSGEYGGSAVSVFHGKIGQDDRQKELQRFRGEARFFVASLGCGSHGLTLNESRLAIFYNNNFKYSQRIQAEDRNHRIGQTKKALYLDIYCRNSIDERIQAAIAAKGNAVEAFKREINKVKGFKSRKKLIKSL